MRRRVTLFLMALLLVSVAALPLAPLAFAEEDEGFTSEDQTGNDPREFSSKFMPYVRYTELENDLEVNEFTLFGFFAFTGRFGMTYELPIAKEVDYSNVEEFKKASSGNLPPIGDNPGGGGDVPIADLGLDGNEVGMGDLGLRFFTRPLSLEFPFMDGKKNLSIMPTVELTVPTATEDVLGGKSFVVSPGITFVTDLPAEKPPFGLAFVAMMNFYDFSAWKNNDRDKTSRYRGRWFYMQPLTPPAFAVDPGDTDWHIFDPTGLYVMTEFQPVYDFEESDFSFWFGPEFGKILKEGRIVYFKPGWGVDNSEDNHREFTFEVGIRYFMK